MWKPWCISLKVSNCDESHEDGARSSDSRALERRTKPGLIRRLAMGREQRIERMRAEFGMTPREALEEPQVGIWPTRGFWNHPDVYLSRKNSLVAIVGMVGALIAWLVASLLETLFGGYASWTLYPLIPVSIMLVQGLVERW